MASSGEGAASSTEMTKAEIQNAIKHEFRANESLQLLTTAERKAIETAALEKAKVINVEVRAAHGIHPQQRLDDLSYNDMDDYFFDLCDRLAEIASVLEPVFVRDAIPKFLAGEAAVRYRDYALLSYKFKVSVDVVRTLVDITKAASEAKLTDLGLKGDEGGEASSDVEMS